MSASLGHLIEVRSRLTEETIDYLLQLTGLLDQTQWYRFRGKRIQASDIYVEPFVLTERRRRNEPGRGERNGRDEDVEKHSPMGEIDARRYEQPLQIEEREEKRWQSVLRQHARLVLKGAPGSGKTFVTKHTFASVAHESAKKLARREANLDEVEIPIWVTVKALGQSRVARIEGTLIEALRNTFPEIQLAPYFREWLKKTLKSRRVFVVVDALDELEENEAFHENMAQLQQLGCRLVVTCRTMQWEERRNWLGRSQMMPVELVPFTPRQQREFTNGFFGSDSDSARSMEKLLRSNFALRHACTTPLLLTFGCLMHEEGKVNESTTYAELYAYIVRRMISGEWRDVKPSWECATVAEDRCLRFLEGTAWELFSKAPEANSFTLNDWRQATNNRADGDDFLKEFEAVGVIAPAGFDNKRGDRCWSFAHRTILEFLAARALSRMPQAIWLTEARKHFWFQPEWQEVLKFLAGLVDDTTPLIKAVEKEQRDNDLFGSMLYLKACLIGASGTIDDNIIQRGCAETFSFWKGTLCGWRDCLKPFALSIFDALHGNGSDRSVDWLLQLTHNTDTMVQSSAVDALGRIGAERAVERLLQLTHNTDTMVRSSAVRALGEIGSEQTVERLLQLLLDVQDVHTDPMIRRSAVSALRRIGSEWAVDQLLQLTHDPSTKVRIHAVWVLGQIRSERAVDRLLDLTRDANPNLRGDAAAELGGIGSERAIDRLLQLTHDADPDVRWKTAWGLMEIGSERAVDRLLQLTFDAEEQVRLGAAWALGHIGSDRAVDRLLQLIHDPGERVRKEGAFSMLGEIGSELAVNRLLQLTYNKDKDVRANAAFTLDEIRVKRGIARLPELMQERGVARLLQLTHDTDAYVRSTSARLLGEIGSERAVNRLLQLTHDEDGHVREAAAQSLGKSSSGRAGNRLLQLTHDKDKDVRSAATCSLGVIGSKRAVERLLKLTQDGDTNVRRCAALSLGKIGAERVVPQLLRLLKFGRDLIPGRDAGWLVAWEVRKTTAEALWRIAWRHRIKIGMPGIRRSKKS